jgi:hypothetical protein
MTDQRIPWIYALVCPKDRQVRYIGMSWRPEVRLSQHLRDARQGRRPVHCWIRKLAATDLEPTLLLLFQTENWDRDERAAILAARAAGCALLNVAPGGIGPSCTREQHRTNMTREQRAEAGRRAAIVRQSTPKRRRLWELKVLVGRALRYNELSDTALAKLLAFNERQPGCFGRNTVTALHARAHARGLTP